MEDLKAATFSYEKRGIIEQLDKLKCPVNQPQEEMQSLKRFCCRDSQDQPSKYWVSKSTVDRRYEYITVTSGSNCERVTTMTECEDAARGLGLSDTSATEEDDSNWPPYCYFDTGEGSLYFNKNSGYKGEQDCDQDGVCICKASAGKLRNILPMIKQYLF